MSQTLFETEFPTYAQSRKEFLDAADKAGAEVEQFFLPGVKGRFDEDLSIDTAYVGPPDPKEMLVVDSGMHGNELFGSAVKQIWILRNYKNLAVPPTVGILLIHALNPHGASFLSRYSSERMDLSRNYLESYEPLCHPHYEMMYHVMNPQSVDALSEIYNKSKIASYICKHGRGKFIAVAASRQHKYPEGVQFSGFGPALENLLFRQIVRKKIPPSAGKIIWVNLHIGFADRYGDSLIITEFKENHRKFRRCKELFGAHHKIRSIYKAYSLPSSTRSSGAMENAIEEELRGRIPPDNIFAFCFEVGTSPLLKLVWNVRKENWWWHHGRHGASLKEEEKLRRETLQLFYPYDIKWRKGLVRVAEQVAFKSIEGLRGAGLHTEEQRVRSRISTRHLKKIRRRLRKERIRKLKKEQARAD